MALLNTKIQNISTSPTNTMAALAKQIKDQENDVISLVIGEPGFSTPDIIKAAGIEAINKILPSIQILMVLKSYVKL